MKSSENLFSDWREGLLFTKTHKLQRANMKTKERLQEYSVKVLQ